MRAALVGMVVLLVACGTGSVPVANTSPTPVPSATPVSSSPPVATPTASSVASTPSPSGGPSPFAGSPTCQLPVTWYAGTVYKAGFMALPSQALTEDRSASTGSYFYDRAFSKWLPATRDAVSPDGKRYAYSEGNAYQGTSGKLHVVDVASGKDRVIWSGSVVFGVVNFTNEGIYLTGAAPEGAPRGLWFISPDGGTLRQINQDVIAPAIGGGFGWGVDYNAADPNPSPGGIEGPRNRVVRVDLATGATTPWFYRPGSNIYLLDTDAAGHPIAAAQLPTPGNAEGLQTTELWMVLSATKATKLNSAPYTESPQSLSAVDKHGIWFAGYHASGSAVWLYASGSLRMVAAVSFGEFHVAGGCIP